LGAGQAPKAGADGMGFGERVPPPNGEGSREEAVPLPRNF